MLDQNWAIVITVLIFIFAYFYLAKPLIKRLSIKIRGRDFEVQSPTTFDLSSSDGRWEALMNILVMITALFITLLLFFLSTESGIFHKTY